MNKETKKKYEQQKSNQLYNLTGFDKSLWLDLVPFFVNANYIEYNFKTSFFEEL